MRNLAKRGCLAAAVILFLLFLYHFNQIDKTELLETEGRSFEKAVVTEIIQDNVSENGNLVGDQKVRLRVTSGSFKGKETEAVSSSGYLFGAHCREGMKVVAIVNESQGEITATVYSADRGMMIYLMVGVFVASILLIGGKKGLASVGGLLFTLVCILFLFLPMIYKGYSPILSAILVVIITTGVTMYLIDGVTRKSLAAIAGTVMGVVVAGVFALIFGKVTGISGWNVSDIENLVYVGQMTDIRIGELLFSGILIAALGAVMDVGMSIASTLNELKEKNPQMTGRELFRSGITVGRDMMGTMSNTLILAFTGGSINTLVFIYAYHYEYLQIINMYSIGIELMQGISASMGVILTVPFTSLVGAWLMGEKSTCRSSLL